MPLLIRVNRMPRWLLAAVLVVLLLLGLLLTTPWAGLFLLVVAAFLGWLLALSWPLVDGWGRLLRGLAVLVLLVAGVLRLVGLT